MSEHALHVFQNGLSGSAVIVLCLGARTLKMVAVPLALRSVLVSASMPKTQGSIEMEAVSLFMNSKPRI